MAERVLLSEFFLLSDKRKKKYHLVEIMKNDSNSNGGDELLNVIRVHVDLVSVSI